MILLFRGVLVDHRVVDLKVPNVDGRVRLHIPLEDKTKLPLYPHAR